MTDGDRDRRPSARLIRREAVFQRRRVDPDDPGKSAVIGALQRRELRVPEDISVTGYDNYTVSDMCVPAITTVEVDLAEMAHAAVSLLLKRIENPQKQPARYVIPGRIILKQSMAEPRKD